MREYEISRNIYEAAAVTLLREASFEIDHIKLCKVKAKKNNRLLYMDIAGKYLPYFGSNGEEAFPWETHVSVKRLDNMRHESSKLNAEPFLCLCYCIRDNRFESCFRSTTKIGKNLFGVKLISVDDYRANMKQRSANSWEVVDLPREKVLQLTIEPSDI